jgi:hypothetical protein
MSSHPTDPPASATGFSLWLKRLSLLLVFVMMGAAVADVSMLMHPRFLTMDDSVGSQKAILDRTPAVFAGVPEDIATWRNRVMIPYAIAGLARVSGLRFGQAYVLMRWLTAIGALMAFSWLLVRALELAPFPAALASSLFAVSLIPTFSHIYEIPSDFLDGAFFSVLTLLALEKRRGLFAGVLLVALLNRESAVFALFVWFALFGFGKGKQAFLREAGWCTAVGLASIVIVTGLRTLNAGHSGPPPLPAVHTFVIQTTEPVMFWSVNFRMLRDLLAQPHFSHPFVFLGLYLLALAALVGAEWKNLDRRAKSLLFSAAFIFLLSILSNNLDELRILIPSLVLTTLVVIAIAWRRDILRERSTIPPEI